MSKKIYLASKSPRRQELLKLMNLDFELLLKDVNEDYPEDLSPLKVAAFIAEKKAAAFDVMDENTLIITADTVVVLEDKILGKPKDSNQAIEMLRQLQGKTHLVVTGVALKTAKEVYLFDCLTKVTFNNINDNDIRFYVDNYNPLDKAGAYGIQDWIGAIAVKSIEGSYTNVMGLPTHELFTQLQRFI